MLFVVVQAVVDDLPPAVSHDVVVLTTGLEVHLEAGMGVVVIQAAGA